MNICTMFHPNQTMGKWSNLGETFSGGELGGGILEKKNENLQNGVAK